ncbi:MAG: glutathione S-transferase [Burkholderiales bacterium]
MRLVGMLDSPYVRRVAVSFQLLGLRFEHQSLSVFCSYEQFRHINPVVKAPSLVLDDGTVLMDSTLILEYAEGFDAKRRSLMPAAEAERRAALRTIGLALAACEKSVQIYYERITRPADKAHVPWVQRITAQLLASCSELEAQIVRHPLAADSASIDQAGVTTAIVWHFTQQVLPEVVPGANYPSLQAFSARAEDLPEFIAAPHGDSTYQTPD